MISEVIYCRGQSELDCYKPASCVNLSLLPFGKKAERLGTDDKFNPELLKKVISLPEQLRVQLPARSEPEADDTCPGDSEQASGTNKHKPGANSSVCAPSSQRRNKCHPTGAEPAGARRVQTGLHLQFD